VDEDESKNVAHHKQTPLDSKRFQENAPYAVFCVRMMSSTSTGRLQYLYGWWVWLIVKESTGDMEMEIKLEKSGCDV
jgi:hypothetical protein